MRRLLVAAAAFRVVLGFAAIPLAPFLYREHVAVLVLLRPSKETLLFAGFSAARGNVSLPVVVAAAAPLMVGAVWLFYALGRSFSDEIHDDDLPGLAGRLLPRERVQRLSTALEEHGGKVVFLARLALMPSTLVAAAAGASQVDRRTFAILDLAGAAVSVVAMLGIGRWLEDAYEEAGPWLTAVGVAAVAAAGFVLGRAVTSSDGSDRGERVGAAS